MLKYKLKKIKIDYFFWLTLCQSTKKLCGLFGVKEFFINNMKTSTRLVVAAAFAVTFATASASVDNKAINDAFSNAPGAEVPFVANKLVLKANKANQAEVALAVLKAAIAKKPAATVAVVSFICSLVPDAAPGLAAQAAKLAPQYLKGIARAAAKSAPAKAGEITVAIIKVTNKAKHQAVYNSVVAAVPSLVSKVNQAVLATGTATGGTVSTVSSPIAALNSDGSVNSGSSAAFPTAAPTAVTAAPGVDPKRYNAP